MSVQSGGRLNNCLGKVYAARHQIAERFYALLFDEYPEVEAMFSGNFKKQKEMFSMMIAMLARTAATGGDVADLGAQIRRQHAGLNINADLFGRGGILLHRAFTEVLDQQIGDFELAILTDALNRLTSAITGQPAQCGPETALPDFGQ